MSKKIEFLIKIKAICLTKNVGGGYSYKDIEFDAK